MTSASSNTTLFQLVGLLVWGPTPVESALSRIERAGRAPGASGDHGERFGATGVEIDLRLSKDGVPFLYHDGDVNLRLTQKSLIWGNIEDFTWPQLRTLLTLRNGEKIPSAREALEYVLEETELKTVWLDTKDVDVIGPRSRSSARSSTVPR